MGKTTSGMRQASLLLMVILFGLAEAAFGQGPVVVSRPESQAVPEGGNAILTVSVTGELPITYKWKRLKGSSLTPYWSPTLDATTCTLVVTNMQASDACLFLLDITNAAGSASGGITTVAVFSSDMRTNGFTFTVSGNTNLDWRIDCSTNFPAQDWFTLTNLVISSSPPFARVFTDPEATNLSRFYRMIPVPN
jgi:hypothetical protein